MDTTPNWIARAALAAAGADTALHSDWLAGYVAGHKNRVFDEVQYQRGVDAGREDSNAGRKCAYAPQFLGY